MRAVTQQPQGYPQPYAYPQTPPPTPVRRGPVRPRWTPGLLAAFAFLIAAGAAGWGTFEKIQTYQHVYPPGSNTRDYTYTFGWWKLDESGPSAGLPRAWFPPFGVFPAIGAGLLVIAAILALSAFPGRRSGLVTGARVSAAAGVGLLAGAVGIRLLDSLQTLDQVNAETLQPGESTDYTIGLGVYLPAGAMVLGIVGLLLMIIRGRAGRVEPETPRMGFAMPYGQQYQQPVPVPVQPASGPVPVQQPVSQPFPAQQPATGPFPAQQPASGPFPAQPQQPSSQPSPEQQPPAPPGDTTQRTSPTAPD